MKKLFMLIAIAVLPLLSFSAYTNSFVRDGATYVQRGGLKLSDYVITNFNEKSSSMTNNVSSIISNTVTKSYVEGLGVSAGSTNAIEGVPLTFGYEGTATYITPTNMIISSETGLLFRDYSTDGMFQFMYYLKPESIYPGPLMWLLPVDPGKIEVTLAAREDLAAATNDVMEKVAAGYLPASYSEEQESYFVSKYIDFTETVSFSTAFFWELRVMDWSDIYLMIGQTLPEYLTEREAALSNNLSAITNGIPEQISSNTAEIASLKTKVTSSATWIRPYDWAATAKVVSDPISSVDANFTTNTTTSCISSNSVQTTYYSLAADLGTEMLDDTIGSTLENPIGSVTFEPLSGGSVSNTRFTATSAGTYRIKATSPSNGVRYVDVPLTQIQSTYSNSTVYVDDADINGMWRKKVNDAALLVMQNATHGGTGVVNGASYDIWWTTRCPGRPISGHTVQGYRSRNALSPHLLVGARHYAAGCSTYEYQGVPIHRDWNSSYLTFHDPVGNTNSATVTTYGGVTGDTAYDLIPIPPGCGFPLAMWAMTNGWTRAELAAMNIEDVMIYPVVDGLVPTSCCPSFVSLDTLKSKFGGQGNVLGWAFSQTYVGRTAPDSILAGNYMTPCIINIGNLDTQTYGACTWTCAGYSWGDSVRADILSQWNTMKSNGSAGAFPPIYGGDSSGGIYMCVEGEWVLLSQYKSVGSGPSFSAAIEVLRALCSQYGDTLKEIQ